MEGVEEERSMVRGKSVNDNFGSGERRGGFRRRERVVSGGEREVGRGEETGWRRGERGCAEGVGRRER